MDKVRTTATVRDVARLAGVSPATVSNVFQDHPRVATETRERVRAAAKELDYRPNPMARSLRSGRTEAIALAVPSLRNSHFAELAGEVIRAARPHGLRVTIEILDGDRDHEVAMLTSPRTAYVDGLIYVPLALYGPEIDQILDSGTRVRVPVVIIGARGEGSRLDQVAYRSVEASRAGTELLLAGGARRIAAIGPHERSGSATPRLDGYLEAHAAAGIDVDPALVRATDSWHRDAGVSAVGDLLREGVPFDAVFGMNDMLALGALRAVTDAGLRVPQDVQVLGFDSLEESSYSSPGLTTIDPGLAESADLALSLLVSRFDGTTAKDAQHTRQPQFDIIHRGSTHPLASATRTA